MWPALDQASKPVTAEDLRGKVLAVDLSIWLVEACTSKLLKTEHKHPHLFLTLSRASFLLRHGALPIVVVEGARHPRKRWKSDRPDPGRAALAAWSRRAAPAGPGVPTVAAGEAEACCAGSRPPRRGRRRHRGATPLYGRAFVARDGRRPPA